MVITKEIIDVMDPGEVFRVVTTRFQMFHEPFDRKLKFVCVRGRSDKPDWAIYAGDPEMSDGYIAMHGDKVQQEDNILSICPCDPEVLALYRH